MKSIEEARLLIETGNVKYRRARRQGEVGRKPWNEYTDGVKRRKTQKLREKLNLAIEGGTYRHSRNIETIYGFQVAIEDAIKRYLHEGDSEGRAYANRAREDYREFVASLKLPHPLPTSRATRAILWSKVKSKVLANDAEKERQSLIQEFGLDASLTLLRARIAARKIKAQLHERAERERLGVGEDVDVLLASELTQQAGQAVKKVQPQGYLYFRCWALPDGSRWYKVGITNDPKRRESEQNVLPVNMETLALASFCSYEQAKAAESSFHKVASLGVV